jgi:hypothetical protein
MCRIAIARKIYHHISSASLLSALPLNPLTLTPIARLSDEQAA